MNLQATALAPDVETELLRLAAYRAKQIERLDRLFRHAGESFETRVVYQAVLDFQMSQRPAP